ncbi:enoyl-CoA hydratase/isomerase family protein [Phenylobacterium sp.]|jgi:enoyl-CoA hydratase|uniref:enoyl-CoA hydratase/isomerase family protein n=1 Tax=Phenylobacterium sp. TaxID=1871053 RepID=UPI002EDB8B43
MNLERTTLDGVAVLRINRPPVNALDLPTILALETAFARMGDERPAGLVLTGAGGVFSAGVDTRAFAAYSGGERAEMIWAITRMVHRLYGLAFPTVAAIGGHALGGGLVMALACDLRIAVDVPDAKLGLTEARAGVPFPAGPLEVIRAELSPSLLRRMTLTSAVLAPAELHALGVVDTLHAAEALEAAAIVAARELAAQPAFGTVKHQLRGATLTRLAQLAASGDDPLTHALRGG